MKLDSSKENNTKYIHSSKLIWISLAYSIRFFVTTRKCSFIVEWFGKEDPKSIQNIKSKIKIILKFIVFADSFNFILD